jgi:hypothetical protein
MTHASRCAHWLAIMGRLKAHSPRRHALCHRLQNLRTLLCITHVHVLVTRVFAVAIRVLDGVAASAGCQIERVQCVRRPRVFAAIEAPRGRPTHSVRFSSSAWHAWAGAQNTDISKRGTAHINPAASLHHNHAHMNTCDMQHNALCTDTAAPRSSL